MKKILFVLLISTMFMWVTIRDGMAQAPVIDIDVSLVMSKSAYDITTTDAGGQVEPIIMAINIKNNSGVDLVVSSPFRPAVAGGNGGNIHLDLTFTNQDGFAVTADEFINQTIVPPPVVINDVPMDRVEIWTAGDEFTITLPNAYAYYPDLLKGEWNVGLLKTLRFYSEFQNINSVLYSPIEPDPDTELPIITEVTITASNFVTLVADEDGDGFSWPIVLSPPANAGSLIVDCDDSPSGADGIPGNYDDGVFINPENLCEGGNKLETLTLVYNGLDCSATSHTMDPSMVSCDDFGALTDPVWIGVNDRSVWGQQQQNVWFPPTTIDGWVNLGDDFQLNTDQSDLSKIKGNTVVHIFDAANPGGTNPNANLLQKFSIHTSCSDPLTKCDQFGAVHVFEGTQVVPLP